MPWAVGLRPFGAESGWIIFSNTLCTQGRAVDRFMENTPSQTDRLERGKVLVDMFISRFDPAYRLLAQYAALPLALTPELLNYLHGRFLHIEVPDFEAEADLLLSEDLCRQSGREQYVMDRDARTFLLDEMQRQHGPHRMQEVARELLEYVGYLARSGRALQELRAQEWAAMAYLDDHRKEAVREIAEMFNQCFLTGEGEGPDVNRAEVARLSRLVVEEIGPQLIGTHYSPIVDWARMAGQILAASGEKAQELIREGSKEFQIPGVEVNLPPLKKLIPTLPRRASTEMEAWSGKGDDYAKFGQWESAAKCYEQGLEIARASEDRATEARLWKQLASVASRQGDTDSAIRYCESALEIQRDTRDRRGESETLIALGNIYLMRGEPTFTIDYYHAALPILSEIGDRQGEAMALGGLAMACERLGEIHKAVDFYERSLIIYRETGDRASQANALMRLGLADLNLDELDRAVERYEQALTIFREMKDRRSEAAALDNLGNVLAAMARNREALRCYEQALAIHRDAGDGESAAYAALLLEKMALTIAPLGERKQAVAWAEDALKIHEQFASPVAERVREQIAKWRQESQQPATAGITISTFEFETVSLDASGSVKERRRLQGRQFVEEIAPDVTLEMVEIPGGTFLMGSPEGEEGSYDDEKPQHTVTVQPFYMGKYQVTQKQWRAVASLPKVSLDLENDPSHFKGDDLPVERVSWEEAVEFCARLSQKTGREYRLPDEAEWEYACRAGATTPFAFGETITPDIVNYDGNYPYGAAPKGVYREKTVRVGSLGVANGFGLYDMHGNVWEWCLDEWHASYDGAPTDGSAWMSSGDESYRVLRGGSWSSYGGVLPRRQPLL